MRAAGVSQSNAELTRCRSDLDKEQFLRSGTERRFLPQDAARFPVGRRCRSQILSSPRRSASPEPWILFQPIIGLFQAGSNKNGKREQEERGGFEVTR